MAEGKRIIVLGATGYTGRLIAARLAGAKHPFIIAGRDGDRLGALASELGARAQTRVVDVRDPASLLGAFSPGDVVINCVGPFTELGEPVVRACVETGAHYLDTTGEQPFMRAILDRYDAAAREAGVTVVPGMAFEYALGDCAVALGAQHMARPLRSVDVIYAWRSPASSRGTRRTVVRMLGRRGEILEQGERHRIPQGARRRDVVMASAEPARAVLFASGEAITVPLHVDARTVRGWAVVDSGAARLVPLVAPLLPIVIPLFRPLIEFLATRRPDPEPKERAECRFIIRVELHDRTGIRRAVEVRGSDPYQVTAAVTVAGARAALQEGTPRGVIPPARLVDPREFIRDLSTLGLRLIENA
jgi:short subunit dehydrogenase-like uncharacterized protein